MNDEDRIALGREMSLKICPIWRALESAAIQMQDHAYALGLACGREEVGKYLERKPISDARIKVIAEDMCMCKNREVAACPGQWEPGCNLGNDEKSARRCPPEREAKINKALGLPTSEPASVDVPLPEPDAVLHHDDGYFTTSRKRGADFAEARAFKTRVFTEEKLRAHREEYAQAVLAAQKGTA